MFKVTEYAALRTKMLKRFSDIKKLYFVISKKQVAQWATIAHLRASIMLETP